MVARNGRGRAFRRRDRAWEYRALTQARVGGGDKSLPGQIHTPSVIFFHVLVPLNLLLLELGRPRCFVLPAVSAFQASRTRYAPRAPLGCREGPQLTRPCVLCSQNFYGFAADSPPRFEFKRGLLLRLRCRERTSVRGGEKTKSLAGECPLARNTSLRRVPSRRARAATGAEGLGQIYAPKHAGCAHDGAS